MIRGLGLIKIIFFFLLTSCNQHIVFEKYQTFKNQEWDTDSLIKFEYLINDTITPHTYILKIRHTVDYEFQNLFLFSDIDSKKDTIELLISNKNGKWNGNGIGDVREVELILEEGKTYKQKGKKKVIIEQAMRYGPKHQIKKLKHIEAVGLTIIKN